ncbi:RIP metalloprotease RseP [Erythrobacter jejuensis]|uniref:Zinc metalloprotease n=2 Tax=Parerythrobacter jejuensis TaxID=795812 RepID=A0A845AST5_9SPHN|nr:RIP metalloprotease RseP [Parerythrobacter jejuensis]
MWIVGFLLLLGPLVTIHELGHYLVGRWFGVKAEAFSIGFGKEIAGYTDKRGTRWKLSALPLGGYVQFKGDMNPASIPDAEAAEQMDPQEREGAFQFAALWKRALIVFAGPATNIIVTLAIFASFNLAYGKFEASNEIGGFAENSVAQVAGLELGDKIVAIDGEATPAFAEISKRVLMYPGETIDITIERDGSVMTLPVTIGDVTETDRFGNESRIGRLGVMSGSPKITELGAGEALALSWQQTVDLTNMMVTGIKQIIVGDRSVKELGGPIKIAKYSGEQLSLGWPAFVSFAALISLNLAFINLLPIPALDGGHLAFYAAEAVRRKPVGPRGMELAYRTGMALVLMLMLFVTFNDLASLSLFG